VSQSVHFGDESLSLLLSRRTAEITDSKVEYGLIPPDNWYQPPWIDEEKASKAREDMVAHQVIYGGESYSH
jgi:alpha 1,2-mannosyltransferase